MASFTAQIGTFDFAAYVRVSPGEGLDPYAKGWEEPAWSDSPFGEGQLLSNVDAGNREMVFPLYLNKPSKDELHALVRDLNRAIRYPDGQLTLTWQDDSATNPTYFDVEYARLDPEFSFRQSAQGWLAGVLRVWCAPPYGHTGTYRVVATAEQPAIGTYPVPSLAGDVGAQISMRIVGSRAQASTMTSQYDWAIVSRLDSQDWRPWIPAASVYAPSVVANAQAIGSQIHPLTHALTASGVATFSFPLEVNGLADQRVRVLCLLSSTNTAATRIAAIGFRGPDGSIPVTATSIAQSASGSWDLVDLGVLTISHGHVAQYNESFLDTTVDVSIKVPSAAATPVIHLNGVFLLPEETTYVARYRTGDLSGASEYTKLLLGQATTLYIHSDTTLVEYDSGLPDQRGVLPDLPPGASQTLFVARVSEGDRRNNTPLGVDVRVRERFTFAR